MDGQKSRLRTFLSYFIKVGISVIILQHLWILLHITWLRAYNPKSSAYIDSEVLPVEQQWISLRELPRQLANAVITAEDGTFYQHSGIDYYELKAAFEKNQKRGKPVRGGSTITMQLARNLYLSRDKNLLRKAREILITWALEAILSKDRILELYLNLIEWGPQRYGAEAGARYYFNKSARFLTAREAAFMAAVIPSPKRFGHWPPSRYIESRMNRLLH